MKKSKRYKNLMKKTFVFILFIFALLLSSVSFAADKSSADDTWAFYIYLIDNDRSIKYNNNIISEMGHVTFGKKVKVISETSWGSPFGDFMKYCADNAKADHQVLIVAGEGEGAYGFRKDNYSYTTLNDIKTGLSTCFAKNSTNPPFDLTLMDGSLMGSVEMASVFNGYSKYLVASETFCYNIEGFYKKWFSDFARNTAISAGTLGKLMVDSYITMVEREVKRDGCIISTNMSVIDVEMLDKAYSSYKKLVKSILKRLVKDNLALSVISKIAKSTVTAGDVYSSDFSFNMIDFNDFMYNLRKMFPVETITTMKNIKSAIKYKKEIGFVTNMCGIGLYFPRITFAGHEPLLKEYVDNIAEDMYLKAFYDYKMYGKFTDDEQNALKKGLKIQLPNLDFKSLSLYEKIVPELSKDLHFTMKLDKNMKVLAQDTYVMVYKREDGKFNLYNEDSYMHFDSANNISVKYDCTWDTLNDVQLPINLLSKTKDYKKYSVEVLLNDTACHLIVNYDEKGRVPMIAGIEKPYQASRVAGGVIVPIKDGESVSIFSRLLNVANSIEDRPASESFKFNSNYKIENKVLPDGEYTMMVIYEDIRGIKKMSGNILFNIRNGALYQLVNESELFANKE